MRGSAVFLSALALLRPVPLLATSPAFRSFTATDGLSHDNVLSIGQDGRGSIWFSTADGLTRFDGESFATIDIAPGFARAEISTLLTDAAGGTWFASLGNGVLHLSAAGKLERAYKLGNEPAQNRVVKLFRDHIGRIWAGTEHGAFRLDDVDAEFVLQTVERPQGSPFYVNSFAEDAQGNVWWGTREGIMRSRSSPPARGAEVDDAFGKRLGLPAPAWGILIDGDLLWQGGPQGLWCVRLPVETPAKKRGAPTCQQELRDGLPVRFPQQPGEVCRYTLPDTETYDVNSVARGSDGTLWVATGRKGLLALRPDGFTHYGTEQHLIDDAIQSLFEDRDGNLWIGTPSGAVLLERRGLVTYGSADGLIERSIVSLFTDRQGRVCALGREDHLQCQRGDRFESVTPRVPLPIARVGVNQLLLQSRSGEWWVRAPSGLYRFPSGDALSALEQTPQRYGRAEGMPAERPSRVFEDARGDLWVGVWDEGYRTLVRRDGRDGTFETFEMPRELGPGQVPTAFAEDPPGTLWLGLIGGALARSRAGTIEVVVRPRSDGSVRSLLADTKGRLWMTAERAGLLRIDQPLADHPEVVHYGTAEGLGSDDTHCTTQDRWGRIYVGTSRGVDRLDPDTGAVRRYTPADGLAHGGVDACVAGGDRLWFGSPGGLASLVPTLEPPSDPPGVIIAGLDVEGTPQRLAPFGETDVEDLELAFPGRLQVDFSSLGFRAERETRFQYQLDGADWSRASSRRSVNFSGLPGGDHSFQVRAVTADGRSSAEPARVLFRVVPPWWRRPWFAVLLVAAAALAAATAVRARVASLLRLERTRTRIAADLHDEVGASLSWIARLSDLAAEHIAGEPAAAREMLAQIAANARQLIDSTSDIVWAIDPRRDDLASVFVRLRRIASDLLAAQGARLTFTAPPAAAGVALDAGRRRELYLLLKEAIHNVCKHARATQVELRSELAGGRLAVEVIDDGAGFDPDASFTEGQGVRSMRRRAEALAGRLQIVSGPTGGTRVRLDFPL